MIGKFIDVMMEGLMILLILIFLFVTIFGLSIVVDILFGLSWWSVLVIVVSFWILGRIGATIFKSGR